MIAGRVEEPHMLVGLRSTPLLVQEAMDAVSAAEMGGLALFVGTVRSENAGRAVTLLEYHAYETMAEKQMFKIMQGIAKDFDSLRLAALHRVGALHVGEIAVICAAATPHRGEAFAACRRLIDEIKAEVPIWKREHGPEGPYWVGWQDARCGGDHHRAPAAGDDPEHSQ